MRRNEDASELVGNHNTSFSSELCSQRTSFCWRLFVNMMRRWLAAGTVWDILLHETARLDGVLSSCRGGC